MPQGDRRNADLELYDVTYDGDVTVPPTGSDVTGWLSGGLGQLTDGEEGQPNFRLDPRGLGIRGYQWIGWRNDSFSGAPGAGKTRGAGKSGGGASVELTWKFDAVRNFSALRIHANNMFTRDVRVFRAARISFSVAGHRFTAPPVEYLYVDARVFIGANENHVVTIIFDAFGLTLLEVKRHICRLRLNWYSDICRTHDIYTRLPLATHMVL